MQLEEVFGSKADRIADRLHRLEKDLEVLEEIKTKDPDTKRPWPESYLRLHSRGNSSVDLYDSNRHSDVINKLIDHSIRVKRKEHSKLIKKLRNA